MTVELVSSPASQYEAPAWVDLTAANARERLTPASVRGMVRLAQAWELTTDQVCQLLGSVPQSTWYSWKRTPPADLGVDRLTRISYLLGIYSALHALFGAPLSDEWVSRPNTNPLFNGGTPLEAMTAGGIPVLADVRALLDGRRGGL